MEKSDIKDVVVAGAGLMGAGISQMFPGVGIKTTLYSIKESDFEFAKEVLKNNLDFLVENRVIDANQAEAIQRSIKFTTDIQCMKDADLIIEAIPENINIKANFYEEICRSAKEDTIIATNTSAISIDLLSNYVTNKKRFCGTHFLNPPHIIPLVEVIKGQSTDGSVCERLVDFFRQLGKKPVLVKHDIKGFLSNRLQFALLREATYLVEEGIASPEDIDRTIKYGNGLRYVCSGPFQIADLGGLTIFNSVAKYLYPELCNNNNINHLFEKCVEDGNIGIMSGKGIYEYDKKMDHALLKDRDSKIIQLLNYIE